MPDWTEHLRPRLARLRLIPAREAEIIEELAQHLDQRYEELRRGDTSDADARRLAIDELLEPDALADHMRSLRQAHVPPPITPGAPSRFLVGDLWQDLRYGLRTLRRAPGFAAVSTLTLALGIGATAVMFSWIATILTAASPVEHMDRLAFVWSHNRTQGETKTPVSPEDFVEWRRRQRSFDRFSAQRRGAVNLSGADRPIRATATFATADFAEVFSPQPSLGRAFRPEEEQSGSPRVAILSDRFWRERFGGRSDVLGREVLLDGRAATIVGVLPKSDLAQDLMLPLVMRQGFTPVAVGLAVGIGAAVAVSQLLGSILYGVTPTDPVTYASVVAILAAVALVACIAPARRAAKVEPLLSLRSE